MKRWKRWPTVLYLSIHIHTFFCWEIIMTLFMFVFPILCNRIVYYKCKEINNDNKKQSQWCKWRDSGLLGWFPFEKKKRELHCLKENSPVKIIPETCVSSQCRKMSTNLSTNSTQWKWFLAARNVKALFFLFFFLVERQGNIRRLYSKRASDDEKTKHKKTKFKILKDPFIMSGCAVHLAE